jgi:hypothetical protein
MQNIPVRIQTKMVVKEREDCVKVVYEHPSQLASAELAEIKETTVPLAICVETIRQW